ncbi:uncharacterized protein Z519_08503 [Cladophialophora bantiana CBS 173.52]|uniref:Uncharacterized protein n=1 Tax=Cladophialophora bantiana (strain ATCC 10958 / CBS 173.52 / CDC B-1940 / NIH 8579) TaxID=1442370 RepID=A0A0D2HIY7_CLAB1|nr:uncharacterized protein Z519_08503 [Cladophialophora bantiana CBS 173.52]KIW90720.1 hypothetical protein Z519_08503 [Cladophialophora bantiana CBS 173.52]
MSGDDSPLFLPSSPPPHLSRSPDAEVPMLVQRAQGVETLSPAFDNFLVSYNHAFFDLFERQIELIKSRSQAFKDGHVSVFDKVLLILTENGNNLNNPAAISFYSKEYLNIDISASAQEVTSRLQQTVEVSQALRQVAAYLMNLVPELSLDKTNMVQRGSRALGQNPARLFPVNPNLRKDMEPRLAVLWSVYETARAEYLAVLDKNDNEMAIKRAKFLRDTAENILLYLENRNADPLMVAELEGTFNHAKNTVVCLTGGKKRKFDKSDMDQVKGTPRGPSLPFRKLRSRGGGGVGDAAAYKRPHRPDTSSGHTGEMKSSYGWGSSDLPSGYGQPYRARYPDPYRYQERGPHPSEHASAPARDYERGYDNDEAGYSLGIGSYNASVSNSYQDRGVSDDCATGNPSDERASSEYSEYLDTIERDREQQHGNTTRSKSASRKRDPPRREDQMRDQSRHRRRSRSPANDRGHFDHRAYPRDRKYEQERDRDHHRRASASIGGRPPKFPPLTTGRGYGHSYGSVLYGYDYANARARLVDSYVPSRDRSRTRSRSRSRSHSHSHSRGRGRRRS